MFVLAALYAGATAVLLVFGLNLLGLAVRRARTPAHPAAPAAPRVWPRVTVQVPLYNEPRVAARVIDACARLDYPPGLLDVQILDDSTDATRAIVAARVAHWQVRGVAIRALTRTRRTGYKAGALAHGLAHSDAPFVTVFDADFVPPPDFLRRTVPHLVADAGLGLMQARWGHLNAEASVLTRVQALLLDAHFVVEQRARAATGRFLTFNGTAGVWRRTCIDAAGGWTSDTLTEDLDLSYRAQLAGWRLAFLESVEAPAELPATAAAWRQQHFRWTKGTAETARLLLGRVLRAPLPLRVKGQALLHLGGFAVAPALLTLALAHAPLFAARALGGGPGEAFFFAMSAGLAGLAGVCTAHGVAQRALHGASAGRRLLALPGVLAASVGLAVAGTRATVEALVLRRRSPFVRTPKTGGMDRAGLRSLSLREPGARIARASFTVERLLAVYSLAGLVLLVAVGAWEGVAFQALCVAGFGGIGFHDVRSVRRSAHGSVARPRLAAETVERLAA